MILKRHAIERFATRILRGASYEDAEALLRDRAASASPMRSRTPAGDEQWRITDPDAILVARRCPTEGLVCVTVLPAHIVPHGGVPEEELAMALERVEAERTPQPRRRKQKR